MFGFRLALTDLGGIQRMALLPIPLPSPMMILTVVVWWVGAGSASSVARL